MTYLNLLRTIPDFPKPGINFIDICPLLADPAGLKACIADLAERARSYDFDAIVGLDARGFIFGSLLAQYFAVPFIPVRKKGKLPGEVVNVSYDLEYGSASAEMQADAFESLGAFSPKILIVDDLLATGGTARAAVDLVEKLGGTVTACLFVVQLIDLDGDLRIPVPVEALVSA